jgi:hypothetical protein
MAFKRMNKKNSAYNNGPWDKEKVIRNNSITPQHKTCNATTVQTPQRNLNPRRQSRYNRPR